MRYFCCCALLLLAACGGDVKDTLGLNRKAPDEFRVIARPPLSVPKEFKLYPPDEAQAHSAPSQRVDGRTILFNDTSGTGSTGTTDTPLLSGIRQDATSASIREILSMEAEQQRKASEDRSLLETFNERPVKDPLIDAQKERERLLEAKKAGTAVKGDDAATLPQNDSTLDWLFN